MKWHPFDPSKDKFKFQNIPIMHARHRTTIKQTPPPTWLFGATAGIERRLIMSDETEGIRRRMTAEINSEQAERQTLEARHGQVWDTQQLQQDFTVSGFLAPFVGVTRKSDAAGE